MSGPSLLAVQFDDSSDRTYTGIGIYDRDNGGVLVIGSGTAFPSSPQAGEVFWRTDQTTLWRRNDANNAWEQIEANITASTIDHNSLNNLTVGDPHTQYFLVDGSKALTGNLDAGGNNVNNVGTVDGRDVSVDGTNLDNHIADLNNPHQTSIDNIVPGTLAQLNANITDATLDDVNNPRTPSTHAFTHEQGGSDEIDGDQLDIDFTPTNYTPDTSPAQVNDADQLSAHLAGIDNAIGTPPVFGTEFAFAQNLPISTTTSTTFQNKVTLGPLNLPAGTYRLCVSYGWNHDNNGNDFEGRVLENGAQLGEIHKQEPKDSAGGDPTGTTQRYYVNRVAYLTYGSPTNVTFDLEYRTDANGQESSIWEATIEIWRVS